MSFDEMSMKQENRLSDPSDLAEFVQGRLKEMRVRRPALSALKEILEVAFFASMRTEEAEQVRCTVAYVDLTSPDPSPPGRIVADRWSYVRFAQPIPLDVKSLVKVSKSRAAERPAGRWPPKPKVAGSNPAGRTNIDSSGPPVPRLAPFTPLALRRSLRSVAPIDSSAPPRTPTGSHESSAPGARQCAVRDFLRRR